MFPHIFVYLFVILLVTVMELTWPLPYKGHD